MSQDKERLAEENRKLKALLAQNGMAGGLDDSMSNPSIGYTSSSSITGSCAAASSNTSAFTPPPPSVANAGHIVSPHGAAGHPHRSHRHQHSGHEQLRALTQARPARNPNLDYEQAGIDFVLMYETPSSGTPLTCQPGPSTTCRVSLKQTPISTALHFRENFSTGLTFKHDL